MIRRLVPLASLALAAALATAAAEAVVVDLPTVLRLADAQAADVVLAREKLVEAKATAGRAAAAMYPWIAPGIGLRAHDGRAQAVDGTIVDADKYSYEPGLRLALQVDAGEAAYRRLAALKAADAAARQVDAQRGTAAAQAAQAYFELAFARAAVRIAEESVRIAAGYEEQLQAAADAGVAFKGDVLRARVQTERNRMLLRQSAERQRLAAAALAQTLQLDPVVELAPADGDLLPLELVPTNTTVEAVAARAVATRPELARGALLVEAAREDVRAVTRGPWIPAVGAQAFLGGMGGGVQDGEDDYGSQQDYALGVWWRVGPGGLLDGSRRREAESRTRASEIDLARVRTAVAAEAVAAVARWQSAGDRMRVAGRALAAADEAYALARSRRDLAVGVVLETVQAEQDLTRARLDLVHAIAEYNQAQYAIRHAAGDEI